LNVNRGRIWLGGFGGWSGVERLELFHLYKALAALSGGDGQRNISQGAALFPVPTDVDRPPVCAVDFPGTSLRLASPDAWTWADDGIQDWGARGLFRGLPRKLCARFVYDGVALSAPGVDAGSLGWSNPCDGCGWLAL